MDENNTKNDVTNSGENLAKQHSIDNEKTQFSTTTTSATFMVGKGDNGTVGDINVDQQMEQQSTTKSSININTIAGSNDVNCVNTSESVADKENLKENIKEEGEENDTQMPILQKFVAVPPSTQQMQQVDNGQHNNPITNTTTSPTKCNDVVNVKITNTTATTNVVALPSPASSPAMRYTDLIEMAVDSGVVERDTTTPLQPSPTQQLAQPSSHHQEEQQENVRKECDVKLQKQRLQYDQQLEQLKAALGQKDNMILLFQRENAILEKEKEAFRKEKDIANKERESTVIKFAMKEKSVIDAKKEKDVVEKQLADARKEIKNYTTKFQALSEEKSRIAYLMDEKCNEVRKYQRECEKLKTDYGHLESKLKYHMNKLNMETEAKLALEKKLEEERNAPNKMEEKANEKFKIEFEAQTILLKHELSSKTEILDKLQKESELQKELIKQLQEQLSQETHEKSQLSEAYNSLQDEHNQVQNSYSEEMLNSAKLRCQLEELQVLKTQNTLKDDKLSSLSAQLDEALLKLQDNEQDLLQLHEKERELLSFNKEMSESIVDLQNQICLSKSKAQGVEAENVVLKKEKSIYDDRIQDLENQLRLEKSQKNDERILLAKHLSEKTKLYENMKLKLENVQGDFEATKNKHATIVKELQREIGKYKRSLEYNNDTQQRTIIVCSKCQQPQQSNGYNHHNKAQEEHLAEARRTHSRESSISTTVQSISSAGSRRGSESSESDTVIGRDLDMKDENKGPSKKHLIERILRLQQASARQAEKIDFLEQHTLSLVAELQKKSKVVQYYMLRDQAGALTSTKSDQNKSELAKYGNGVMSAIYGGIKGVENKSMSLDLSLEINKKLQAVLEDTLLKNITLKENLDVLGLEVDNLTRKLRQIEAKR